MPSSDYRNIDVVVGISGGEGCRVCPVRTYLGKRVSVCMYGMNEPSLYV